MNPVSLYDLEKMAQQVMPYRKWTFVDAGAADEITVRRNREAFDEITVNPRFLVDVGNRDSSIEVLGEKIDFPVMVAPAGSQRDVHPDGERATAAAAGAMGYALRPAHRLRLQHRRSRRGRHRPAMGSSYTTSTDEVSELLVTRAKTAGYKAICLTVDTPAPSPKERDVPRRLYANPPVCTGEACSGPLTAATSSNAAKSAYPT